MKSNQIEMSPCCGKPISNYRRCVACKEYIEPMSESSELFSNNELEEMRSGSDAMVRRCELISECIDRAPLDPESKTELLGDICQALAGWCQFCGLVFKGDHAQNECEKKRISETSAQGSESRPGVGGAVESNTADEKGLASRVEELERALMKSDSYLSILRHRAHVPWGSVGFPTESEVDQVIGQSRRLLAQPSGTRWGKNHGGTNFRCSIHANRVTTGVGVSEETDTV